MKKKTNEKKKVWYSLCQINVLLVKLNQFHFDKVKKKKKKLDCKYPGHFTATQYTKVILFNCQNVSQPLSKYFFHFVYGYDR